jgi:glycosyltransferase involved in cell wall biosynthesis
LSPEAATRITLCVATRDRPESVERILVPCLRRLPAGCDAIVIDQSTTGRSAEHLEGLDRVVYRRMAGPGLSRARNLAVDATTAPLLAFTDDDVRFESTWLDRVVTLFDAHPAAGAVCGGAVTPGGTRVPGAPEQSGVYRWPTSPFGLGVGLNMAVRREAIDAAGRFDEELGAGARFHAAEDTDMLYRVMREGWSVVTDADLTVVHQEQRSRREWLRLQYRYGVGIGAQTAKHAIADDRDASRLAFAVPLRPPPLERVRPRYAAGRLFLTAGMAVGSFRWRRRHA